MIATLVLLLAACDNNSNVEKVRLQPLSGNDPTTLGEVLNRRQVCDKTHWTQTKAAEGGDAQVEYQCDVSARQTQALFSAQWDIWQKRYQQQLATGEERRRIALERKSQASPALLDTAYAVFEQLQASGELAHYKALISGSPVHNKPLDEVNAFFASDKGKTYLTTTTGAQAPAASKALAAVNRAILAAGLATQTRNIDVCKTPALLVLAVILTPEEVKRGFDECRVSLMPSYERDVASAEKQIATAQACLAKLASPARLLGVKEIITWRVPDHGTAALMTAHTLYLEVGEGENRRQLSKTIEITNNNMVALLAGDFNRLYQSMQIDMMSDLLR